MTPEHRSMTLKPLGLIAQIPLFKAYSAAKVIDYEEQMRVFAAAENRRDRGCPGRITVGFEGISSGGLAGRCRPQSIVFAARRSGRIRTTPQTRPTRSMNPIKAADGSSSARPIPCLADVGNA